MQNPSIPASQMAALIADDRPVSPSEASALLASLGAPQATNTLAHKRVQGGGPAFMKFGRQVRYRPSELRRWATEQLRSYTSTAAYSDTRQNAAA